MAGAWFERRYVRKEGLTRHKLSFRPIVWQGWLFLAVGVVAIVVVSALAPLAESQLAVPSKLWVAVSLPAGLGIVFGGAWVKSRRVESGDDAS